MKSAVLYITTVLIWGSTWLAIEFQLGDIAVELSLFYRFAIAALLMWLYVAYKKPDMRFKLLDHGFFALLAICNFGLNYLMLYWAQNYLTSAMTSIAFSMLLVMNIVNTRLFFGKPISKRIYTGAVLAVLGITCLFWPQLQLFDLSNGALVGLLLALGGTFVASLGNMVSVRNSRKQIGVLQGNAWGMLYSAIGLALYVLMNDVQFSLNAPPSYWLSLLYLSIFGTVIAFGCYFALLRNIGPEKASYVIVLFPLVAVTLSSFFEGFEWHANTFAGFSLVLLGNAIVLTPTKRINAFLANRAMAKSGSVPS
ncbi:permease of the drug/metabolite transporter (DMT) superfamily [Pseudoalteromonas sp. BSi20652]|uniref:DMT family transporter n=1 Tax=Pseudoalteromonas sp. BSi20652 TaxID=388384 RepID=UPI0002316B0F|nr:EamA family transporter [Pseudoalteromonas sp. BSi20652]GAA60974.1 permease of the drug/metabolite transporter (DMT) superfamily [Pseudoalteromonas sp. BSi20652]